MQLVSGDLGTAAVNAFGDDPKVQAAMFWMANHVNANNERKQQEQQDRLWGELVPRLLPHRRDHYYHEAYSHHDHHGHHGHHSRHSHHAHHSSGLPLAVQILTTAGRHHTLTVGILTLILDTLLLAAVARAAQVGDYALLP